MEEEGERHCIRCDHCKHTLRSWSVDCECTFHNYDVEPRDCCEHFTRERIKEEEIELKISNKDW